MYKIGKVCLTIREACAIREALTTLGCAEVKMEAGGYWETIGGDLVFLDYSTAEVVRPVGPKHTTVCAEIDGKMTRIRPHQDGLHPAYLHVTAPADNLLR